MFEQILASHPDVHGAGELPFVYELTTQITSPANEPYPLSAAHLEKSDIVRLRDTYLSKLPQSSRSVVVDKAPMNFLHLGLISAMFPTATVVLCERDFRDIALSIYFQHFQSKNYFAYDLYEIGRFVRQYQWLVEHWSARVSNIVRISYESMITDQYATTRALLAGCRLTWDDACLDFHRTTRDVRTASAWQVRQPIAKTSVNRWQNYASHIDPFQRGLAGVPNEEPL